MDLVQGGGRRDEGVQRTNAVRRACAGREATCLLLRKILKGSWPRLMLASCKGDIEMKWSLVI